MVMVVNGGASMLVIDSFEDIRDEVREHIPDDVLHKKCAHRGPGKVEFVDESAEGFNTKLRFVTELSGDDTSSKARLKTTDLAIMIDESTFLGEMSLPCLNLSGSVEPMSSCCDLVHAGCLKEADVAEKCCAVGELVGDSVVSDVESVGAPEVSVGVGAVVDVRVIEHGLTSHVKKFGDGLVCE